MKTLFRAIIILLLIGLSSQREISAASTLSNETLHYTITYKWGVIHKDAAKATLRLSNSGGKYHMLLTARTLPWADKVFMVRDTLKSTAIAKGFTVTGYEKTTHEGGKYSRDVIKFTHSGNSVKASTTRVREDKKKGISRSSKSLSGMAPALDMLSVFYYIRLLDLHNMPTNQVKKFSIFSGNKVETLSIRKTGVKTITMRNKSQRAAYRLNFTFTQNSKKKSSDDILVYVSADGDKVPLYLVGKLPIGEVRVYLDN
ncbi:MAG: DUF3108 domain-containing protein [Muribaculaceae bacterium]|nr:DUF3108 domain-containing protein [Muribaculaceae bacterium]